MSLAKKFLLRAISLASPTALSSSQLKQVDRESARTHRHTHCVITLTETLYPYLSFLSGLLPVECVAPAGVPVCRRGPRGGSSSQCAPRPPQPKPRDGLPLTNSDHCLHSKSKSSVHTFAHKLGKEQSTFYLQGFCT